MAVVVREGGRLISRMESNITDKVAFSENDTNLFDTLPKDTYLVPMVLTKSSLLTELDEIISLTEVKSSSEKLRYLNTHTGFISYKMVSVFEYMFNNLADKLKLLCDFNEPAGLEACEEIRNKLEELDTDDDYFPQSMLDAVEMIKGIVAERKEKQP